MTRWNGLPRRRTLLTVSSLLLLLVFGAAACRVFSPAPTATPVPVTPTATPDATATANAEIAARVPIVDDGKPLAPQVIDQTPSRGGQLNANAPIEISFDQPMDAGSVEGALQVEAADGSPVAGAVSWPAEDTLRFTPQEPLVLASTYRVVLDRGATSKAGLALPDRLAWQFNTVGELEVQQVIPSAGATDVEVASVITVIFNRPVAPLGSAADTAAQPSPLQIDPPLDGEGEWVNTSVYTFRPSGPLGSGVTYTVMVPAGVADATGDSQLASNYEWQFTTAEPRLAGLNIADRVYDPPDHLDQVLLDDYFNVSFFQPMDQASTEAAIRLEQDGGNATDFTALWNENQTQVTITPTQRLAIGSSYTFTVGKNAQAATGAQLKEGLVWHFNTVPLPAIRSVTPSDNAKQTDFNGQLEINFASPMKLDTLADKVEISPAPPDPPRWWFQSGVWGMSTWVLQPSTRYEVRILPGMEDIYGNAIQEETVVRFTTGQAQPFAALQMPWAPAILRAAGPQEIYISYRNIGSYRLALSKINPADFIAMMQYDKDPGQYTPPADSLVWSVDQASKRAQDETVLEPFTLTHSDGRLLDPGFYYLSLSSPDVNNYSNVNADRRLVIVANANLTLKTGLTDGLAWLTDLESGQPLAGAAVRFFKPGWEQIASGETDAQGLVQVALTRPEADYAPRFALVDDGRTFAFASDNWGSGVSPYDFGIWSDFYSRPDALRAYVYTERPLYRPGQPVYFKGIVRRDNDVQYSLPDLNEVQLVISNYKGEVYSATLPVSAEGTFNGQYDLAPETDLGAYFIAIYTPGNETERVNIGGLNFSVAEYRKPEFQVSLTAAETDVLAGAQVEATLQADYYSGGGVPDAKVTWSLVAEPFFFTPPDAYSSYNFTDIEQDAELPWGGSDEPMSMVIAQGDGRTDASGKLVISAPADLAQFKTARKLTLEAVLEDISGATVAGRVEVVAHKAAFYLGIRPQNYIGTAGEAQTFEMVALDWAGQPVANQKVDLDIVERQWSSVQEQDAQGNLTWTSTVEDKPVVSFTDLKTDAQGKVSADFTPAVGGVYRGRVTGKDAQGNLQAASAYLWVSGKDFIPWRQSNDRSFELVADKTAYQPGETAEILIASPFQGAVYALVTVERGTVRYAEVVRLENNSTIYRLPITPDFAPNVFISVVIVKGVDDANPRPNFRLGMLELKVAPEQQTLTVNLTPDRDQVQPGDTVNYTVQTLDAAGAPVSAEVSLSLTDLATLSLADPNSPKIGAFFYNDRSLSIQTAVPIVLGIDEYNENIRDYLNAQGEGMGAGGGGKGGLEELGVIQVRGNFPDTAFWQAEVATDSSGQASVSVTLPDNLTTWRMEARAATRDTKVGQATVDIQSSKPLLVRPQTPRFFVQGDVVTLGTAVQNNTGENLSVNVSLDAQGITLATPAQQQVDIAAGGQAYLTWEGTVEAVTRVDLAFIADGGSYQDASRPTAGSLEEGGLPVYRYEVPETVGASGQLLSGGTMVEALTLPRGFSGSGEVKIKLEASLAASMTEGLTYLEHFEYECIEQTVSRFLPNVLSTQALQTAGLSDAELEANLRSQVAQGLQRLASKQNGDGGWGWWGQNEISDPLTTAYVVLGLVKAQGAGYPVDATMLARAVEYLNQSGKERFTAPTVNVPTWRLNRQAFVLYVLTQAGSPDPAAAVALYEDHRQALAIYARAFLTQTLYLIDAGDPRIQTLLSDFANAAVVSATGTHWEEPELDRYNWNSDVRTTAIVLETVSQIEPQNPFNANAVRWLMSTRVDGHWNSTQETAWSLMALTRWMEQSGELTANYDYAVALNGERLGGGAANADTLRQVYELRVSVEELLKDTANRLAVARTDGPGSLYYTAHLTLDLPVPDLEPLDKGVIVARSYYRMDGQEIGSEAVTEAARGELLLARLTLVAPAALHYVLVDDPLPAGLEVVDQSLNTSPQSFLDTLNLNQLDLKRYGWNWWSFDHIELRDEKVVLSAQYLPAGTYEYTYVVRAGTPGAFGVIPPTASEFYFPEVYGRGAGMLFTVRP